MSAGMSWFVFRQLRAEKNLEGIPVAVVLAAKFCTFLHLGFYFKKEHWNEF
jgi:hypothetical protein